MELRTKAPSSPPRTNRRDRRVANFGSSAMDRTGASHSHRTMSEDADEACASSSSS